MSGIDESTLDRIERKFASGLSSADILDLFAQHDVHLTEATLRKYVQLGLLPRSVRVGKKGKHQGSQGLYPVSVVRQIVRIKEMMADNYTIEQIKRDVLFMRSDILELEATLDSIFATLGRVMKERRGEAYAQAVARDVEGAKALSRDLVARLGAIESRLSSRSTLRRVSAS
jgi:3-methyladenine DNA glycosylase/8-oxoguanine DNA glycosylase